MTGWNKQTGCERAENKINGESGIIWGNLEKNPNLKIWAGLSIAEARILWLLFAVKYSLITLFTQLITSVVSSIQH